jgi:hypothetical protein
MGWAQRLAPVASGLAVAPAPAAAEEPAVVLSPTLGSSDRWAAAAQHRASLGDASGLSVSQLDEFCSRGMVVLPEEQIGLPPGWHEKLVARALETGAHHGGFGKQQLRVPGSVLPFFEELLTAPGVEAGVASLLGPGWAVMPFSNGGQNKTKDPNGPGSDQHWHCDENGPQGGRKVRHQHPIQLEILYYPQRVTRKSGATCTIPYSQYYYHNHEEDHDNFAGADHLDLDFMYGRWEGNPDIPQRTHRLLKAVDDLGWPLCQAHHTVLPSPASVLLMNHNMFHRAARREDNSYEESLELPRYMFRFLLFRTTDPEPSADGAPALTAEACHDAWRQTEDHMTGIDLTEVPTDCTVIWDDVRAWTKGEVPPLLTSIKDDVPSIEALRTQLGSTGEAQEPQRMGASHKLARLGQQGSLAAMEALGAGIASDRESVRRAAMYGAAATGGAAMAKILLRHIHSDAKWRRKAACFALGEGAPLTTAVVDALITRLKEDDEPSVYVRSVAAFALGCVYRRSIAHAGSSSATTNAEAEALQQQLLRGRIIAALLSGLDREQNRLDQGLRADGMRQAANPFGAKMWRPTDINDVCEGGGAVPPEPILAEKGMPICRFEPVCSAVRGAIGMSLVTICTHPVAVETVAGLVVALSRVILTDKNVVTVVRFLSHFAKNDRFTKTGSRQT